MPPTTSLTIPANTPHTGWNPGPLEVEVERWVPDAPRELLHDLTKVFQEVIRNALA